ncbi:MAG: FMN-binding protein [Lachnospiraceae bacterium]|nr:FMN-binding protein [Lachnospiraceae bacterium]
MKQILKRLTKLKDFNLIQFVPFIFIISLAGNSIFGYTEPKVTEPVITKEVSAESSETDKDKKAKSVSGGDLDLSKIKDGTYEGSGTGFHGTIKVSVTVKDHKITAINVLNSSDDASFFNRAKAGVIAGIISSQSLNVDVVSGATYSSKGIIAAVKNALTGEVDHSTAKGTASTAKAAKLAAVKESGTYKDGTYTGSAKGWGGTTKVSVSIKNNKIINIKVLSNQDTPSYFNKAKSTIISSILKKQSTNVDAVSGATYSSNGIIKAVRNALSKAATTKKSDSTKSTEKKKDQVDTSLKLSGKHKDGTYKGSGEGYHGGTTTLSVTIKNNRMTKIKVVSHEDTPSFFASAKKLFKTMIAKQSTKVDVVSGATMSSNGIIEAVNEALAKAQTKDTDSDKKDDTTEGKKDDVQEETGKYKDGTYTGIGTCETNDYSFDPYSVQLDIIIQKGKITTINNFVYGEAYYLDDNEWYMNRALNGTPSKPGMIKQIIEKQSTEVDIVSGATCSSRAIIEAVGKALAGAQ